MPSQVNAAGNRELFLITLGCIPWSNCLYTLEIALSVRPYALQKHKTALCYLLISQKALVTLVKEKKKKASGAGCLGCLVSFSGTCPKYVETLVSAPWSSESARPSVYSLPALSLPSEDRGEGMGSHGAAEWLWRPWAFRKSFVPSERKGAREKNASDLGESGLSLFTILGSWWEARQPKERGWLSLPFLPVVPMDTL